ncbi:PREDICTED: probable methyltransferase PMT11 [Nelumbo nucifera]|uniref:Methyltransferase n=1 Tax=Nelumbo nucifera TaxID=4432 RepID=A0A1U8AMN1_NELNU|nr:PREDICTED: probable methyltransferase PMT11 [Nelumbo nucifera]
MKGINNPEILKTSFFIKLSAFALISFALFYFGRHYSDGYDQLFFYNSRQEDPVDVQSPSVAISPNAHKASNLDSLTPNQTLTTTNSPPPPPPPPPTLPPPPPQARVQRTGILDENGRMSEEFEVGEFDPELIESWGSLSRNEGKADGGEGKVRLKVKRFELCSESMREYIPCLDNVEEIQKLKSTERGEKYERHCPGKGKGLNCLVPAPKDYKAPLPWPKSRDKVWSNNVPYTHLVEDKGGQNWISREKDKYKFLGGATQFIHGADQYLDQILKMVPNIAFGHHTQIALDVDCGVASFGAFLLAHNVNTLSIAPKDVHENQIQFALERGVPAMVATFATQRLLYPSQAFDLIHCSMCRINWTQDDGILLLEVNRMLRAGGYFVWAAEPVYKHDENLQEQWKDMEELTLRLCWELVKKEGYIAIWRKPLNNSCYINRGAGAQPPLCDLSDNPDNVWYVGLKACITRLPENGYGANITAWPARLHNPPDRLQSIEIDAYISRKELFKAESRYWYEVIESYIRAFHWKKLKLRNVMDMRAGFGGFAAALHDLEIDCWVMNVVPVSGPNTLPVIYDRGLIGVMHDWCEPFDTYPRTYDLLHAWGLFSTEQKRCNISTIMLEMDRMLRPGGRVYIRDLRSVVDELKEIATAMGWHVVIYDTAEGPHASWRILMCEKQLNA